MTNEPGRIEIHMDHVGGVTYYHGAIWPLGRAAAVNAAQVREFQRAIDAGLAATQTGDAA